MVFIFKLVLLGDKESGKTSLLKRYVDGNFVSKPQDEYVTRNALKQENVDGKEVKLQLLELQNEASNVFKPNASYRGAHAVLLLFSLAHEGYKNIPTWLEEISRYCYANVRVILVGTKVDSIFSSKNASATSAILSSPPFSRFHSLSRFHSSSLSPVSSPSLSSSLSSESNSLSFLPLEILNHVFEYLDLPCLLFACFVSWDWYRALNSQYTWMRLYKRDFKPLQANFVDWKNAYIQKYLAASSTWSEICKAKEIAIQYGLPLVLTSARTGLNVNQLFSEVALLLCGKLKQTDVQQSQEEMRTVPLWRGKACTVLMKEKIDNSYSSYSFSSSSLSSSLPHIIKIVPEPHRLQILDSTLLVRRVDTMGIKMEIKSTDIILVTVTENKNGNYTNLNVRTKGGRVIKFLFETKERAENWRAFINNM